MRQGNCGQSALQIFGEVATEFGGVGGGQRARVAKAFQEFTRDVVGIRRAATVAAEEEFAAATKSIFEDFRRCRDVVRAGLQRRITLNESLEIFER